MKSLLLILITCTAFGAKVPTNDAAVPLPQDLETCFSPDEACDVKLWKLIQSTKKSLDVAVFDVTHPKIIHEILVASKKVPTRILVDRRQSKGKHSLVSTLLKANANVRFGKQRGLMHNKFVIVDGAMIQTGSFNYTMGATEKNNENQIYIANPAVIARYQARFDEIWEKAAPSSLAKSPTD